MQVNQCTNNKLDTTIAPHNGGQYVIARRIYFNANGSDLHWLEGSTMTRNISTECYEECTNNMEIDINHEE